MTNKINILLFAFAFLTLVFVVRDLKKSDQRHFEEVVQMEGIIRTELESSDSLRIENEKLKDSLSCQLKRNDSLFSQVTVREYKINKIKKQISNEKETDFLFYPDSVVLDILSNKRFETSDQK